MLENKKNVRKIRKILIALIVIVIMTLGVYIKIRNSEAEAIEIETLETESLEHMKASETAIESIDAGSGTVNPIYKPEWEKVSSSYDAGSKKLTVIVKGSAYESQNINENADINYASNVISTLSAEDITVFVDGVKVTSSTNPTIVVSSGTTSTNETTGKTEITHTIEISNFEQSIRQARVPFKEWSGNVKLKIAGRGKDESTYEKDVLTDQYGNQNMMETDQNGTNDDGTWIDVTFEDAETNKNTANTMFADFIIPEITYEYANTTINHNTKKVIVVFDVTDKYFANSVITKDDITIAMLDDEASNVNTDVQKTLTLKTIVEDVTNATTGITYKTDGSIFFDIDGDGVKEKIGQRYELVIEGLEQLDENGLPNGYTYSGPMSIAIPNGELNEDGTLKVGAIDNSGNLNSGKTITIGVDETDGNMNTDEDGTEQIVDVVDPIWTVGTLETNDADKSATITLTAKDKYLKESTLTTDNITVYVNGVASTAVVKNLSTPITTLDGIEYTLTLSNLESVEGGEYVEFIPNNLEIDQLNNSAGFKYRNENGGSIRIEVAAETIEDQYQNFSNLQGFDIGIIDLTKPEVYEVQKTKDLVAKTETIIFNVTDKNYNSADLVEPNEITVYVDGEQVNSINKYSLTSKEIKTTIDETEKIVGHQYTLVLSNIDSGIKNANGYIDWSGTVEIKIAENAAKDEKGNTLNTDTTTISDFVDFTKPVIEKVTVANPINTSEKTYTFKFTAIDKYMNTSDLIEPEEIKVYVDGEEATSIRKSLSSTAINKTFNKTVNGVVTNGSYTIGHEYTLVLSEFEQASKQSEKGKDFMEWSGTVSLEVLSGAVKDQGPNGDNVNPNVNDLTTISGDHVDFIKPVIEKASSTPNATAKTETIIFNVMDKYLDTSDALLESEITVYVDKEAVTVDYTNSSTTGLDGALTKTAVFVMNKSSKAITTQNGNYIVTDDTIEQVVGEQYQLVLSNFEQAKTSIDRNREYSDWSGTVEIEIAQGSVKDTTGNINDETTLVGDFVDFIKPNVTYEFLESNIVRNHEDKTLRKFTMVFDITDKYFVNSTLATEYANASTEEAKLAVLQNYLTIMVDGEDITNVNTVTKKITSIEDVVAPLMNKTTDVANKTIETDLVNEVIGKRFTLEISNLEQDMVALDKEYLDYSGVITVAIDADMANDNGPSGDGNNSQGNVETTITSGYTIALGTVIEDTSKVIDLVDPLWEVAGTVTAQPKNSIATIPIKGTDKYILTNNLQEADVTITVTSPSGIITVTGDQAESEGMTFDITPETINYGKKYTLSLNGYTSDAYQVKITLDDGILVDESGNTSQETEFVLFSSLKETSTETAVDSGFLGNTNIERQKIEQVIFQDNLNGRNATRWDVSQLQDQSIWGWYETTARGTYKVYIGSYIIINGNTNSSYLFANLGRDINCATTGDTTTNEMIENLDLLHVDGVRNMAHMFEGCGYAKMQSLDLGNAFDTTLVTDMSYMFKDCGYTSMISLDLGEKFDTANVTNMSNMFNGCGQNEMIAFRIGETTNIIDFDTTNVANMSSMFQNFGHKLPNLTVGADFDITSVTDMSNMFNGCGQTSMTTLDLGVNFNTAKVTNMSGMFQGFAQNSSTMTSLDLGNLFYTTSATDMSNMFNGCGQTAMTTLDLGPAFTKIASTYSDFITNCGNSSTVIYAPESIYSNMKNFKLNTSSSTTITLANAQGTINPVYRPEWTKISSDLDTTTNPDNPTMTVVIKGTANKVGTPVSQINYVSEVTHSVDSSKITVYIDDEQADSIAKTVELDTTNTTASEVYYKITLSNFEQDVRRSGKSFKEWSGNISVQLAKGTLFDKYGSSVDGDGNVTTGLAGNQNLAVIDTAVDTSGNTTTIDRIEIEDATTDRNTTGIMFADKLKPEITYISSETTIGDGNHGDTKILTVVFYTVDKYFDSANSRLELSDLTFQIDGTTVDINVAGNTLTAESLANGIGTKYTLVVKNLEQTDETTGIGDGFNYSGTVSIVIPANKIVDLSQNKNVETTITIGIDDKDGNPGQDVPGDGTIVDVVDPIWRVENINLDELSSQVTLDLIATDKYYASNVLTPANVASYIKVYIDGVLDGDENNNGVIDAVEAPTVTLTLSSTTDLTPSGTGVKYTLILKDWDADKYSGKTVIKISGDTITDNSGNTSKPQEFLLGHIDFIKPVIEKVSSTTDTTAKTETIIFNVKDRYLDTSDLVTLDVDKDGDGNPDPEIIVYVDGERVDNITMSLERVPENDVSQTINGTSQVVSQQYRLVLSDFEKARNGKGYKDWSGTVEIKFVEGAVKDIEVTNPNGEIAGGNVNAETILRGDFVDFIKPELQYTHQSTDINTGTKKYTMTFDVTDKYYTSGQFTEQDILDGNIEILMQNGQKDSNGNAIVYNLKNEPVTMTLSSEEIKVSSMNMTNTLNQIVTATDQVIGHTYTLTISDLEKLERKSGLTTADYSGVITVGIPADRIEDRTIDGNSNKNVATTITSGVNIPGGTGNGVAVDVVSPIWERVSSSANAIDQTATITFKGTDTYFKESTLTSDKIEVYVNGSKVTTGITKDLSTATPLEETRIKNNGLGTTETETVQYGVQYTLTVTGFAKNANQVKIKIPAGTLKDETKDADNNVYNNVNKDTELILYNCLELTNTENAAASGFLDGDSETGIARQDIEKVIFVNSFDDVINGNIPYIWSSADKTWSIKAGIQKVWDVSAQGDDSILAWTKQTSAPYTVYIGSPYEIFANQDSSYLFSYIGYGTNCDETEVVTNLDLLNTNSVTNMSYMFNNFGYRAMTTLSLGVFDTTNVTNMTNMFNNCGNLVMTELNLGTSFNTSNVEDMSNMFSGCGQNAMTTFSLGNNFNTAQVTNMSEMFQNFGQKLGSLNLGTQFYTSAVTNMSNMFNGCGQTEMTTLTLGNNFNTSQVTNMSGMFQNCGQAKLTSLDLGNLFYTTAVTDMSDMFNGCGQSAMTALDLGPAFTKIASNNTDFITNCGITNAVIYAPESIYKNKNAFKLSSGDTNTDNIITYSQGTINPIYKPEWTKVSSALKPNATTPTSLEVTIKGNAIESQTVNGVNINYNSNVTSTLEAGDITVYINGVQDGDRNGNGVIDEGEAPVIQVAVSAGSPTATDTTEITHTITLTNFEEATRQLDADGKIKKFSEWSGNISIKIAGREEATDTYTANILTDVYGNQSMSATDETGSWIDVIYKDPDTDRNTDGTMFTDFIKPEITYEYSETAIDYDNKILTVVFYAADKYFDSTNSSLALSDFYRPGTDASSDGKAVFQVDGEAIDINVEGNSLTAESLADGTGTKYTLVVNNLQKYQGTDNDAFSYSGTVSIAIPADKFKDYSGNANDGKTITIGIDEPTTGDGHESDVVVDVVDPIWKVQNLNKTTTDGITTATMDLIAIDKFFKESTLEKDDIQVIVAGVNIAEVDEDGNQIVAPELQRTLSEPTYIKWDNTTGTYVETTQEEANGVKYTFTVSHLEETYEAFFAERAKYAVDPSTGRLYREYSGPVEIVIPAGTAIDQSGNTNIDFTIDGIGHIDTLKPEVIKVSSTPQINTDNVELSKHIVVFDIVDKYLDTSAITMTDTSKIHVYLDGELTEVDTDGDGIAEDTVTKTITNIEPLRTTVGTDENHLVGYRYTLELSNFQNPRSAIDYDREYTDWSGDLTIKIDANTAYDTSGAGNAETILAGNEANTSNLDYADFVDYIKPDATYQYADTDISEDVENGKTFTMTFDITDKFYREDLSVADLQILISEENETGESEDGYNDLTNNPRIGKSLRSENRTNVVNGETKVIGKRYTLVLTNLEQVQRIEGNYYLDYSGAITIVIPEDRVKDSSGNGNDMTSITSGINIPGGEVTDIAAIDVVAPIWERTSFTTDIHNKTATINLLGTDKYFFDYEKDGDLASTDDDGYGTLTSNEIKLFVNGIETTGNITISGENRLYEERLVLPEYGDGDVDAGATTETVQYGVEYTITITNFPIDANQVKIQLTEGSLIDKSNNNSRTTEFLVYNTLRSTATENELESSFLAEIVQEGKTAIERQDIEKVIFVNSIEGSTATGVQNVWDVSAQRDNSIIAWYSEAEAPYTVYIGSNDDIYGNVDSSYLFSYIGYSANCTDTDVVEGLNLLHTENVTNMSYMFNNFGYRKLATLNLGAFDTKNVANMQGMFNNCGNLEMTSLNLGTNFNTSEVTNMSSMFQGFAQNSTTMTTLDLGATGITFNTSKVTDMSNMFNGCGKTAMTTFSLGNNFDTTAVTNMSGMFRNFAYNLQTLTLGANFNTNAVTDMSDMFNGAGKTAMTTLTLGNNFNTSAVQNMSGMFQDFAGNSSAMITLDLGEKFYTTSATNMTSMFNGCGSAGMTSLDLGPAFTKIADVNTDFVTNCGKSGAVIKAPESIYNDMTHFKLSTDSSTTIQYTQGTINPKYKPEWTKVSSTLTIGDSTITIVVNGKVDSTVYANAIQTITSTITAGNDESNLFTVKIDGEDAESITQTVEVVTNTATEVQYKITLSNFKEDIRQIANNKNFLEWAGNIALQFARGTLVDAYGNKNMILIDDTDGNWYDVEIRDTAQVGTTDATGNWIDNPETTDVNELADNNAYASTNGIMFTDYIKPEFTYEYADTVIGSGPTGDKKVIVVFNVTDKYFASTQLSTDSLADLITVKVDEDVSANTAITKTLTKLQDLTYTVNGDATHKVGERYQLIIEGLESEDGVGYSGPMTLAFPDGIVTDKSGNSNVGKTITIGIDEPTNHEEHKAPVTVDVVNPLWTGPHNINSINRTNDTVSITIFGSDKYYASNTLAEDKITVYVDDVEQSSITKALTEISATELQTLLATENLDLGSARKEDVKVGYILTLSTFRNISGTTKIVIDAGTITDTSGNVNLPTTIFVGNINWVEANELLQEGDTGYPRYPAFRQDIVDFIDPVIKYQYSAVENAENPDIDYEAKTVTVKFTVTDKYFLESTMINADGTLNTNVVRIYIDVNGTYTDVTDQLTKDITEASITDGKEYTLVVSNLERNPYYDAIDFSGPMQLVFAANAIDDTSGNKNVATTITIDTDNGDNPGDGVIVDVVDPIIKITADAKPLSYRNALNSINRDIENETGTVKVRIRAEDKYLDKTSANLVASSIKVKVQKPNGTVVDDATKVTDPVTVSVVQKSISDLDKFEYEITLSNFTTNEGIVSIIIPENIIKDTSGNGNKETEVYVGNADWADDGSTYRAFNNSIVDFTRPTWTKVTSSIARNRDAETGTVTLKILGYDIYYQENTLSEEQITVYVNGQAKTITKALTQITDTTELTDLANQAGLDITGRTITDVVVGYTLTLSNFGTNDGQVTIKIADNTIKDSSGNGNSTDIIYVGNPTWVETDVEDNPDNPKYTAFRPVDDGSGNVTGSIVDFIKPVITYQYEADANPLLDRTEEEKVYITFTATDTNFLESNLTVDKLKIFIDDMQVYGTGSNETTNITPTLTGEPITEGSANGIKYTLTLSALELNTLLENEIFERHSGVIKIIIPEKQVEDSSGNKNIETTIIVDNGDGDDVNNGIIVDFVNPNIYYYDKYIDWEDRYALITIRATDRFYDTSTVLQPSDITLWQQNRDGDYVQITNIPQDDITITSKSNGYGYDFIIKLNNFEEEFRMKITIPEGKLSDTSGNTNDYTEIFVDLDNKKPTWEYVSTDTTDFEAEDGTGTISFNVKGVDKFLDLENSGLTVADLIILKDGEIYLDGSDSTDAARITVTHTGDYEDENEKSKAYKIDITGVTEVGTYSLVFAEATLIDTPFGNESAATTITFSKSVIASNTANYTNITYHVTPDMETVHKSYVHELMSVNTTGTNYNSTTYRPSTIGELHNDGENPLFAEPMYEPVVNGYDVSYVYSPKSFAGWAEADSNGNPKMNGTEYKQVYGLYDEIPNTVTHLRAIWQDATVVFVSNTSGDNSNDGQLPTTPVKDLATAYTKLNSSGTAENNIIVIMDAIEWNSAETLTGNATITSLYAGVDYRKDNNAELKVSSNMTINGDITFDNIELYANSTTVSDGSDYLGNGTYTNMLISNYSGDITLGRRITSPYGKYTFGAVIGGNYKTETSTGELGTHTIRVEAGKYNNIIAGSTLTSSSTTSKFVYNEVVIGNMKDTAVSRNDKLTITGYVAIGENEQKCYPNGATGASDSYNRNYADVTLYSGTFTGDNKFAKTSENIEIYARSIDGETDGKITFTMYGGNVTNNIYAGTRRATSYLTSTVNTMKFYGGQVNGNIFGQGSNGTFAGSSEINLEGNFSMTGNIFGGSNVTTSGKGNGEGNTSITVNSSSIQVNGNIYGGSNGMSDSGYVEGTTTITLRAGTVTNIYGSGNNSGNSGATTITIENGGVTGNIVGGAYNSQGGTTATIAVLGGTVNGNIYGGNENTASTYMDNDTKVQNINIKIGDTDVETQPTINGIIYGSGKFDKVGTTTIELIKCANLTSVFGGSDANSETTKAEIYLKGMTVNEIYGGGKQGTVTTSNIYLQSGAATDVYGGGFNASVTTSNILLEGTSTVTSIYGGSSTSGTVTTSNVTLKSGTVTNVFGGGNSASVGTANVTLDGITINTIHGGSKDAGVTTTTNVTLKSGTVTNVFGGGLDVGVTTSNVTEQGAAVTNIYGGNNSSSGSGGETGTTNVNIIDSTVVNVYGGNYLKGTTRYANITIQGTSVIQGKLFGGGYQSEIGTSSARGSATINISGGTINNDINGGSEQSKVYGTTNINIGKDAMADSTLKAGTIEIKGTIYGAGDKPTTGTDNVTVDGDTHILIDNSTESPIIYQNKTIYGSGKNGAIYANSNSTSDGSKIHLKDFGTEANAYVLKSIEDTGDLYIGNSFIELTGNRDTINGSYYTLNRVTNALTEYANTTLYTRRGFNKVGGFNSYETLNGNKARVGITGGAITSSNVNNRLYTLEGINLIFCKDEVKLSNKSTIAQDRWGEVKGMTFFGMYALDESGNKVFDIYDPNYSGNAVEGFFATGTYVEGQHNASSHSIYQDGFYTNVADYGDTITVTPEYVEVVEYGAYHDWLVGANTVNYELDLIASTYGKQSVADLLLDYEYAQGAVYTLNKVSFNAITSSIKLIDQLTVPTISANANNTFGLTMETNNAGWLSSGTSNILYNGNVGSFTGDTQYSSDNSSEPGSIRFKLYNSINITKEKDLGNVNLVLTGQNTTSEDGNEGGSFIVVISISLQTIVEEQKAQYEPSFTGRLDTELHYTTDSKVDLSYLLYKDLSQTPYETGDYRVISTTEQLPAGTRITMKDYLQGAGTEKIYYYHVTGDSSEYEVKDGRYLYKLSNFIEMGNTSVKYTDNSTYYHDGYVLERYDISIDFIDSGISANKLQQETYLELRSSTGTAKYDNGGTVITYNLYNQNAEMSHSIGTIAGTTLAITETQTVNIPIDVSLLEQKTADGETIMDTKYYDKIGGIAVEIVDENGVRPTIQNFTMTNKVTGKILTPDNPGAGSVRFGVMESLATMSGKYELSITPTSVPAGDYKVNIYFFASDDGEHHGTDAVHEEGTYYYGKEIKAKQSFNVKIMNKSSGLIGIKNGDTDAEKITINNGRIVSKETGMNLNNQNGVNMTIKVGDPTEKTNIRVELYKRNPTYTEIVDGETGTTTYTYNGTSYTTVLDISQYLEETTGDALSMEEGSTEYIVSPEGTFTTETNENGIVIKEVIFNKAIKQGIDTGEYKLVFKLYHEDILLQTVSKTFIVTQ